MEQISLPRKTQIVKQEGNHAVFEIKPCYPGYGVTLGNSLRRVLLSSLPGASITAVKLKGVSHEFSTIPYILEDVVQIILNLKEVRIKMHSDMPVTVFLKAKGEKEVKASDIETTSDLEIINKDAHIATLTDKKAELEIEIRIEKGHGYVSVEQRAKEKMEIGMIAIDAVFSPIKKINYEVEDIRVGERTDYNRLVVDLETDGSITPEDAIAQSSKILAEHFEIISSLNKDSDEEDKKDNEDREAKTSEESKKTYKIDELGISARTLRALEDNKIKSVSGLIKKSEDDLINLEGLGEKGVKEIKKALSNLGFSLKN